MIRIRAFWEHLRGTYWAVPSGMAVLSLILGFSVIRLDEAVTAGFIERLSWVYTGGPEGARAVLATIASSMITVAGVVFSITIVALTLASQQFGPRLLHSFLRDIGNQIVLGTFISTFLYCLLVLRTVRGNDDLVFVPHLAVTVGVALATASLGVLIFFIHHVATSIQASRIIANVAGDLEAAIERLFPERIGESAQVKKTDDIGHDLAALPRAEAEEVVHADSTGYIQAIDSERVLTLARERDLVIRLQTRPGRFIREGDALLTLSPCSPVRSGSEFRQVFVIGTARTGTQDVTFFVNQLVEVAVRALSPGINDPETARTSIDRLQQALCQLARRDLPSPLRYDAAGRLRVIAEPVTFASVADAAFDELAFHARASVSVTCHLLDAVASVAPCLARDEDRDALENLASNIADRSRALEFADVDVRRIASCHRLAMAALGQAAQFRTAQSPREVYKP